MSEARTALQQVMKDVNRVILGKEAQVKQVISALLAGGHVLLTDLPGTGKTTLAETIAGELEMDYNRVQFTPDVLPSDLTGFSMYQKDTGTFVYQPGSVMCNLLLADEINRTSPKTQSALLEVMEEQKVTVDGRTHEIPSPFIVIATQNPFGSAGTWMLPEAQLDRFMVCLKLGYPSMEDEIDILKGIQKKEEVQTVISSDDLLFMQYAAKQVYVQEELYQYVGNLANQTRNHSMIDLGLSPRGTINILQMAKSVAFLRQREYVVPEDVKDIFFAVCGHRIMLSAKARAAHMDAEQILKEILKKIKAPRIV